MRFWLALTVFTTGLVLSAVGIVNQLENRPLDAIVAAAELEVPTTYVLIPNDVLTAYEGETTLIARGDNQVFVGLGRESDLVAWLGDTPYVELALRVRVTEEKATLIEIDRAGGGQLSDPVGSDIFQGSEIFTRTAELKLEREPEVAALVASTGLEMAPRRLQLTWNLEDVAAPVAPVTLIGLGLIALGGILGLWAAIDYGSKFRSKRTRSKPKKSRSRSRKSTSGRRTARVPMVMAMVGLLSLSGCVAEYENPTLVPKPLPAVDTLTAVMDRAQLERILADIELVVSQADENLDRESIEARVDGPALQLRRFAYNLARRSEEGTNLPTEIKTSPVQLFLPSATDTWPRSVMVVTGEEELQMLVLRQESAREQYKLYHYIDLLPGAAFPEVAAETVGANAIREDNRFLFASPLVIPDLVGELLNDGPSAPASLLLDPDNDYIRDVSSVQRGLAETLSNANLNFAHALGDFSLVMLATADGGALVSMLMVDTYTIIPNEPGDAVAISGNEALLLGSSGSATGIETRYGSMLLFHIPSGGAEARITLLGATQQLMTAVALGAQ
ncbi:MAG: hypothetical protein NWQ88_03795 [Aquiluna sp.]|nr:hypothetical protein [Aquiluna sp.]MDP4887134.1 hypothetical protein [Aquiluna sp.]